MRRTPLYLGIIFLAAVVTIAPSARAQEKPDAALALLAKFETAMKLYSTGQYDEAAKLLDEVIKAKPSSHDALLLREKVGMGEMLKLLRDPKVRDAAAILLRQAAQETSTLQRDAETIKKLVAQTGSEEFVQRETAVRRLVAIGPFAVPWLLDEALSDDPFSLTSRRVAALRIIRESADADIPPLLVAFENARPEDAIRIARMIEESPDARAVPVLAACAQNKNALPALKLAAEQALAAIRVAPDARQNAPQIGAAQACLDLAVRYYYSDVALLEITPVWQRVAWTWNSAGKSYADRLTAQDMPAYVYPRAMADALLLRGMKLPHDKADFLELYICNNYMQIADSRAAGDTARAAALEPIRSVNESLGASYLYMALGRALKDGSMPLAQECVMALRAVGDTRLPSGPNTLVSALSAHDKVVRAGAAEALMFLSPSGDAGAPDKVIETAAAALGATLRPRVLVLTQSDTLFKSLAGQIVSWNMIPERCFEQLELVKRTRDMTPPVSLLILDTRLKGASAVGIAKMLRSELAEKTPPAIFLAPQDDLKKITADAAGVAAAVLPVPPPAGDIMKASMQAVESSKTRASEDILQNTELVRKALATIAQLPRSTKYPARELAGTMVRLSGGYPQDIRILAMKALASMPSAETRDAMFGVFANAKEPVEVRRAAGAAFQEALMAAPVIAPERLDTIRKLTADADKEIASCALHALAIAAIPQAERESRLLDIGPKAK